MTQQSNTHESDGIAQGEGDPRPAGSRHAAPVSATAALPSPTIGPGHDYTSAVYGSVLAATVVVSAGDLRPCRAGHPPAGQWCRVLMGLVIVAMKFAVGH